MPSELSAASGIASRLRGGLRLARSSSARDRSSRDAAPSWDAPSAPTPETYTSGMALRLGHTATTAVSAPTVRRSSSSPTASTSTTLVAAPTAVASREAAWSRACASCSAVMSRRVPTKIRSLSSGLISALVLTASHTFRPSRWRIGMTKRCASVPRSG
ncbi:hypothetical protein IFM12275_05550 [Nocardia sputorum]|nr:hypothetical protein IFM12275_05550 [Nocardia sputorum]